MEDPQSRFHGTSVLQEPSTSRRSIEPVRSITGKGIGMFQTPQWVKSWERCALGVMALFLLLTLPTTLQARHRFLRRDAQDNQTSHGDQDQCQWPVRYLLFLPASTTLQLTTTMDNSVTITVPAGQ